MKCIKTNIVIIGSGLAALQCARLLNTHFSIALVTKTTVKMSSSYRAQGGIAAVTASNDSTQLHIDDTLAAGDYHHNVRNVQTLVQDGAASMKNLLAQGIPVDRDVHGEPLLGLEGAHRRHRILHAGGDATGKQFVDYFLAHLPKNILIYEQELAYELLLNRDRACIGVQTVNAQNEHTQFFADHIIIASGGAGALYEVTSNFETNTGDGIALAWRAGAAVTDMEFMQFHPSLLYVNGQGYGLVSEAVRGQGGYFVNAQNEPIMAHVHPLKDLAPRHITAHTLYTLRQRGEETFLNITAIDHFEQKFPTIAKLCETNGIDISNGRIPVAPGSHFLMGGIVTNHYGETSIPHLYAIGEAACTGVHGANRLASNSLLECIAFGERLAATINARDIRNHSQPERITNTKAKNVVRLPKKILKQKMEKALGIIRHEESIVDFLNHLPTLAALQQCKIESLQRDEIELLLMHCVARLMAEAALARTESRGCHIRTDYANQEKKWAKTWLVFENERLLRKEWDDEFTQTRRNVEAVFL